MEGDHDDDDDDDGRRRRRRRRRRFVFAPNLHAEKWVTGNSTGIPNEWEKGRNVTGTVLLLLLLLLLQVAKKGL